MKRIIDFICQECYLTNTIYLILFILIIMTCCNIYEKVDSIENKVNSLVEVKECQ